MIDRSRRNEIYISAFIYMIEKSISTIPVSPEKLCKMEGIELVPLTRIIAETGLSDDDIFSLWGNKDGVLQQYGSRRRIAYNDSMPLVRQRFTIMEELSHGLLNHIKNPGFNVFNQQYDRCTYAVCEEEARMCAGLILCPPQYYYNSANRITLSSFQQLYNVSAACAQTRIDILRKYEDEIKNCEFYDALPKISCERRAFQQPLLFTTYSLDKYAVIQI